MVPKRGFSAADLCMATIGNKIKNFFRGGADVKTVTPGDGRTVLRGAQPVRLDSAELSLTLSTVYRCGAFLSDSVAKLPLLYERKRGAGIFTQESNRLAWLLRLSPNEYTSAFDFWRQAIFNVLFHGEAYIIPMYSDITHELLRLVLCAPGTVARVDLGRYLVNDLTQGLRSREYDESEIIRLKGRSLNGLDGVSVITFASTVTSIAGTADRNTLKTFANGGTTMGFITNEQGTPGYGEYATQALQDMANDLTSNIQKGDLVVAIGGKAHYQSFTMTAADMQALETRKFTVRELCRFFGVHPSFVFDDTSLNYKSAENAYSSFLTDTLRPMLRQIEDELARKLIPETQLGKRRFRFAEEDLYAADLESRMRYTEKRIQTGTMTVNEARAQMGMQPVEGGDIPLISANLRAVSEVKTEAPAEPGNDTDDNNDDNQDNNDE